MYKNSRSAIQLAIIDTVGRLHIISLIRAEALKHGVYLLISVMGSRGTIRRTNSSEYSQRSELTASTWPQKDAYSLQTNQIRCGPTELARTETFLVVENPVPLENPDFSAIQKIQKSKNLHLPTLVNSGHLVLGPLKQ